MDSKTLETAIKLAACLNTSDIASAQGATIAKPCCGNRIGEHVIIRTFSAGVHFGILKSRNGQEATLMNARRIWSWRGANTLNEIAVNGVDQKGSNISQPVPEIDLLQAIEVIPTSPTARVNLEGCGWTNK